MTNNSDERNFRRRIKLFEEEEIDRRLKEAGLYDCNDSFETRKQIVMQALGGLVDTTKSIAKHEVPYDPNLISFQNEFNIVDDEDDVKESITINNSSTKQHGKKPHWKSLYSISDEEEFDLLPAKKNPAEQSSANLEKDKPKKASGKAKAEESYGSKMLTASLKKHEVNPKEQTSSRTKKINLLKVPDKRNQEKDKFSESIAVHRPEESSARKDGSVSPSNQTFDMDDDDFLPLSVIKEKGGKSDQPSSSFTQVPKIKATAMKLKLKKYSEILKLVDQVVPNALPVTYDFQSKGSYEKLIEKEERLKRICQESCYKPVKWRWPIMLDIPNNRKRRPMFNPPFKKTSPPREVEEDINEIFSDSPPASSLRKLDLSPQSPILETGPSRNKYGVEYATDIIDTEMESPPKQKAIRNIEKEVLQECPICNKSFPLAEIEGHAAECFSFEMDEEPFEPLRSERIATRSVRSRQNWNERGQRGNGSNLAAGSSLDVVIETDLSDKEDDGSDFEFNGDSGTKRNRKRSLSKGKKRRI